MSRTVLLFGPPGTGKTTALLTAIEAAMKNGVRPNHIAYAAFSRKAAEEGATRAQERFGLDRDDLPFFRTLHSLAYRQLELSPSQVMGPKDWTALGERLGLDFRAAYDHHTERADPHGGRLADRLIQCYSLARARLRDIETEWREGNWTDLPLWAVERFARELEAFKAESELLDFTDFLDEAPGELPVDLFVLDEAQDLTPQQWAYARRLARGASSVLLAGDDDQAIYGWAGADAGQMRRFNGTQIVLPISHRLPRRIHSLADRLIKGIRRRKEKTWAPRDEDGFVEYVPHWEAVDMAEGSWLVLARHRRALGGVERYLRAEGIVYQREGEWSNEDPAIRAVVIYNRLLKGGSVSLREARLVASMVADMPVPVQGSDFAYQDLAWPWTGRQPPIWWDALDRLSLEDGEYIRALLRRGESLSRPGRVILSTIHGAKGGEADYTLLVGGWPRAAREEEARNPDDETRVKYVAATRSRKGLLICPEFPL